MIPTRIGQVIHGGTFAGFNRIRNSVYGIIVAPKSTEVDLQNKLSRRSTPGTQSTVDGLANTTAMDDSTHPAARYCKNLVVDGLNNWHLPSKNELELAYRYLKPLTEENYTFLNNNWAEGNSPVVTGKNLSSIPIGMPYTEMSPKQTIVTDYINGSKSAFTNQYYWSSTEHSTVPNELLIQSFLNGDQLWYIATVGYTVRCVRRELVALI